MNAIKTPTRDKLIAEYKKANAAAKAAKAKADHIRDLLVNDSRYEWLEENEANPTSSVDIGGMKLVGSFRPKITPGKPDEFHDAALEIKIDGKKIPPRRHAEVAEAIAALGLKGAATIKRGVIPRPDALTRAMRDGADTESILAAYTFSLR